MISVYEFVGVLFGSFTLWMLWSLRGENLKRYFSTDTGKGILKGIVLAMAFILALVGIGALAGCSGKFINDAHVYGGLDYTKKSSPSCVSGTADDNTTSNLGVKANLYESVDKKFRTNAKYTHHSCAFYEDDQQYDAVGVELEYQIWSK